ncbi:hypothetical protein ACVU7I_01815 [Patulibacter sp. S7RM1-6]
MSTPAKDYSGPEYDIVREHHVRPYALHYEEYDARRAKAQAAEQETAQKTTPGMTS